MSTNLHTDDLLVRDAAHARELLLARCRRRYGDALPDNDEEN